MPTRHLPAAWSFAAAVLTIACALAPARAQGPRIMLAPNLPVFTCYADKTVGKPACADIKIPVRIFDLYSLQADGTLSSTSSACLAALPYNGIKIVTSKTVASSLTWTIDPKAGQFVGQYMQISSATDSANTLTQAPIPASSAPVVEVKIPILAGATSGQVFNHLPVAMSNASTSAKTCLGVDPIIVNSSD